jgi:hypothetical protein
VIKLSDGHHKQWQGVEKQASGHQPRRAAFWKAQTILGDRCVFAKAAQRRITA